MVLEHDVLRIEQIVDGQNTFALGHALFRQQRGTGLFIHSEMFPGGQTADDFVHLTIQAGRFIPCAGNDQRRAGFVDKNGVDFVHNGEVVSALHQLFFVELHVVAQIVEAEFVVRAVGDVGVIGDFALFVGKPVYNDTHGKSESLV